MIIKKDYFYTNSSEIKLYLLDCLYCLLSLSVWSLESFECTSDVYLRGFFLCSAGSMFGAALHGSEAFLASTSTFLPLSFIHFVGPCLRSAKLFTGRRGDSMFYMFVCRIFIIIINQCCSIDFEVACLRAGIKNRSV